MVIDNFNILTDFLKNNYPFNVWMGNTTVPHIYLTVSVIRRNKDIPEGSCNLKDSELLYKTYVIRNISDLEKYKDDIIMLCDGIHARAYITYNAKDYSDIFPAMHIAIANKSKENTTEDYAANITALTDTVLKNVPITRYNDIIYYCLDIDGDDYTNKDIECIKECIKSCNGEISLTYKTINGCHILYHDTKEHRMNFKDLKTSLSEHNLLEKDDNNTISIKSSGCRALLYANIKK